MLPPRETKRAGGGLRVVRLCTHKHATTYLGQGVHKKGGGFSNVCVSLMQL